MMQRALLIGIGSGLVSSLLFVSITRASLFGIFATFFLAPLPLAIAGLGWGATAGLAAAATGTLVIVGLGAMPAATFYAAVIGLPMAALTYLLMLSRQVPAAEPNETLTLEWYPPGRIVAYAALWGGALAAIVLLMVGFDVETLHKAMRQNLDKMLSQGGALAPTIKRPLTEADKDAFVKLMVTALPGALATSWMILAILNLWLAGHAARISGRLIRPWPDLAAITLPPKTPIIFAAAALATFLGGMPGLIASGFAFALLSAYTLVGLAILHWITRPIRERGLILVMVYLALVMLNPFSSMILAVIGLSEPVSPLRRRPLPPTDPPSTSPG